MALIALLVITALAVVYPSYARLHSTPRRTDTPECRDDYGPATITVHATTCPRNPRTVETVRVPLPRRR